MNRICLIYNFGQHYRLPIFKLLDQSLPIDFYFGDKYLDVKPFNYEELNGFKNVLNNIKLFKNIYWQKSSLKLLFNDKYDRYIILGDYNCLSTWILLLLNKIFYNKKIYLWSHGFYGNESHLKTKIKLFFFKLSYKIFLYGNYSKKIMKNLGYDEEKLVVIYNSLNYENQIFVRNNLDENYSSFKNFPQNKNASIVFSGRLTKQKKINLLIESSIKLFENNLNFNVLILGNGSEMDSLKLLIPTKHLKNFYFLGEIYDENIIAKIFRRASICVSPGNVGLTAIHSLVYGTPVITHNNYSKQGPEFEAIKPGVTGDFFKENSVDSLAELIEIWLKKDNDDLTRSKCYKIVDDYYNPKKQLEIILKSLN